MVSLPKQPRSPIPRSSTIIRTTLGLSSGTSWDQHGFKSTHIQDRAMKSLLKNKHGFCSMMLGATSLCNVPFSWKQPGTSPWETGEPLKFLSPSTGCCYRMGSMRLKVIFSWVPHSHTLNSFLGGEVWNRLLRDKAFLRPEAMRLLSSYPWKKEPADFPSHPMKLTRGQL